MHSNVQRDRGLDLCDVKVANDILDRRRQACQVFMRESARGDEAVKIAQRAQKAIGI